MTFAKVVVILLKCWSGNIQKISLFGRIDLLGRVEIFVKIVGFGNNLSLILCSSW